MIVAHFVYGHIMAVLSGIVWSPRVFVRFRFREPSASQFFFESRELVSSIELVVVIEVHIMLERLVDVSVYLESSRMNLSSLLTLVFLIKPEPTLLINFLFSKLSPWYGF